MREGKKRVCSPFLGFKTVPQVHYLVAKHVLSDKLLAVADELRQRGEIDRAQAIDTIVEAVRTGNGANGASAAPEPVAEDTERIGDLYGVPGPTLKKWVEEGRYTSYRVGKFSVPRESVEEYVRLAGPSLDLEEISDEEAAELVAEERGWA